MKDNSSQAASMGDRLAAGVCSAPTEIESMSVRGRWEFECFDKDGNLKWRDYVPFNLVVNTGLDDILDKYFKGSAYTAAHYVGLTDGTPTIAAGDTMASHAGWTEIHTQYSESTRPAYTPGTVSSQSVDNSASKASYTFTSSGTTGGAFLTTNSTKNGTTGTLVSAGAFTEGDKAVDNGDTATVTVTYTTTSS